MNQLEMFPFFNISRFGGLLRTWLRGEMGVQIVGGRAGTASQGTKFMGDRVPRCSGWPAATALRVVRPSSPRAQRSTLCPMNLTLDGGARGQL